MASNNQIVIIGRVGNDIARDIRELDGGNTVVKVSLAVDRSQRNKDGDMITDWIRCEFWNRQAEILAEYVQRGELISVTGDLRVNIWEKDGQKRQEYYIHGDSFRMLTPKRVKEKVAA